MKTKTIPTADLNPGDKIYIPWPEDREKPNWWKTPDVLTVRKCEGPDVYFRELGGLSFNKKECEKIIDTPEPVAGDLITFSLKLENELGITADKEFSAVVKEIVYDPKKEKEPECLVKVEEYNITSNIPISRVKNIEKQKSQLEIF